MGKREDERTAREREAQQALERVQGDSETLGTSSFTRVAERTRDHFSARDKQAEDDPIEVWGTRIGRGLGFVFAIALVIYLVATYF
ncbi:hypothetical protein [Breoghania sp.]|uniref:hypothetical protein n=1 Tax=Breoghania sp. TaxID=2065378 RepID=UPI002AA82100|nr:hypothetical protein [Breoghania sp.]